MDTNNSRTISYEEFKEAMKKFRMDLNDKEAKIAFNALDLSNSGVVDYDEALKVIGVFLN